MPVKVRIATPLRAVTQGNAEVKATGDTVDNIIGDLERQYPGLRDRLVDETGELRRLGRRLPLEPGGYPVHAEPGDRPRGRRRGRDRSRHRRSTLSAPAFPVRISQRRPGVHPVGHPRDDPGGEPGQQRRPLTRGCRTSPPPPAVVDAAHAALDGDLPPVRDYLSAAELARPHRRQVSEAFYGMDVDPERHIHRVLRLNRDHAVDATCTPSSIPATRSSSSSRSTRTTGRATSSRGASADLGAAGAAGLLSSDDDPDPAGPGSAAPHAGRRLQQPQQSLGRATSYLRADLQAIADLCLRHDLLAITDEIYEHVVDRWPRLTRRSRPLPGMAKQNHHHLRGRRSPTPVTGWRVGWAVAPEDLSVGIRRAHDFVTVKSQPLLQEAAAVALGLPASYYVALRERLPGPRRPADGGSSSGRAS